MAAAVAGEVLGPRPGKAICSFWQGTLEIVLWIATILVSINCGMRQSSTVHYQRYKLIMD